MNAAEAAIRALPGARDVAIAHFRPEVREGYLLAIEEASAAVRSLPQEQWAVLWDDRIDVHPDEEVARHEAAYPVRPDAVNPQLARRVGRGPWVVVPPAKGADDV